MSNRPSVSVVIPTLNEAHELPATLDSVVGALGPAVEIVVVDGGSNDHTAQLAAERVCLVQSPRGRGRQLNAGARATHGEVLLFLHADTWLPRDAGTALADALSQPNVVGGSFKIALRGPSARRTSARLLAKAINLRSSWFQTATGDQAIFARRSAFEEIGGMVREELFEDVVFYGRLRKLGDVKLIDTPVLTSDRRWRKFGYLRTSTTHLLLRFMFSLGVAPSRLARLYRRDA